MSRRYDLYSRIGGHERALWYETAAGAASMSVSLLHDGQEEPVRVDGQLLWDAAMLRRIYEACEADLAANRPPRALARLRAREVRRAGCR